MTSNGNRRTEPKFNCSDGQPTGLLRATQRQAPSSNATRWFLHSCPPKKGKARHKTHTGTKACSRIRSLCFHPTASGRIFKLFLPGNASLSFSILDHSLEKASGAMPTALRGHVLRSAAECRGRKPSCQDRGMHPIGAEIDDIWEPRQVGLAQVLANKMPRQRAAAPGPNLSFARLKAEDMPTQSRLRRAQSSRGHGTRRLCRFRFWITPWKRHFSELEARTDTRAHAARAFLCMASPVSSNRLRKPRESLAEAQSTQRKTRGQGSTFDFYLSLLCKRLKSCQLAKTSSSEVVFHLPPSWLSLRALRSARDSPLPPQRFAAPAGQRRERFSLVAAVGWDKAGSAAAARLSSPKSGPRFEGCQARGNGGPSLALRACPTLRFEKHVFCRAKILHGVGCHAHVSTELAEVGSAWACPPICRRMSWPKTVLPGSWDASDLSRDRRHLGTATGWPCSSAREQDAPATGCRPGPNLSFARLKAEDMPTQSRLRRAQSSRGHGTRRLCRFRFWITPWKRHFSELEARTDKRAHAARAFLCMASPVSSNRRRKRRESLAEAQSTQRKTRGQGSTFDFYLSLLCKRLKSCQLAKTSSSEVVFHLPPSWLSLRALRLCERFSPPLSELCRPGRAMP